MATSRGPLAAIATTAVITAILASTAPVRAVSSAIQAVFVVNTATNPVPVRSLGTTAIQGTVAISNTPAITLNSSGNTVKIDPVSNTVQVTNTVTSPLFVDSVDTAATQAFQAPIHIPVPCTIGPIAVTGAFTVPVGERLVIETIGVQVTPFPNGYSLSVTAISTTVNGQTVSYPIPIPNGGLMSTQLYADGGTSVVAMAVGHPLSCSGDGSADVSVSGHLVPLP